MTTGVITTGAGPILIGVTVAGFTEEYIILGDGTIGTTGAGVGAEALAGIAGVGAEALAGITDGAGTTGAGEAIMAILITDTVDMDVVILITAITIPEGVIITEILWHQIHLEEDQIWGPPEVIIHVYETIVADLIYLPGAVLAVLQPTEVAQQPGEV
jgi:hypothetical protein